MKNFRVHLYVTVRVPIDLTQRDDAMTPLQAAQEAEKVFMEDPYKHVSTAAADGDAEYAETYDPEVVVDELIPGVETIYHSVTLPD